MRRTGLRVLVFLLLLSAIASPGIAAGPGVETPSFAATLWHALTSLFAPGISRVKSGSIMDPNGCPAVGSQAGATPDLGSVMDPDG